MSGETRMYPAELEPVNLWVMSQPVAIAPNAIRLKRARHDRFARPSPGSSNPAGCNDGHGLPHLPGVATVSQILSALEAEYTPS